LLSIGPEQEGHAGGSLEPTRSSPLGVRPRSEERAALPELFVSTFCGLMRRHLQEGLHKLVCEETGRRPAVVLHKPCVPRLRRLPRSDGPVWRTSSRARRSANASMQRWEFVRRVRAFACPVVELSVVTGTLASSSRPLARRGRTELALRHDCVRTFWAASEPLRARAHPSTARRVRVPEPGVGGCSALGDTP